MSSVYVVCWIFLQTFQTYFCIQANSMHPDQTAPRNGGKLTKHVQSPEIRWSCLRNVSVGRVKVSTVRHMQNGQIQMILYIRRTR